MSGINTFVGCGRLVKDATVLRKQDGSECGYAFRVAIDAFKKEETLFIDVTKFITDGKGSGVIQYLTKGISVVVAGRLVPSEYKDGQGQIVKGIKVIASNIQLVGGNAPQGNYQPNGLPNDYSQMQQNNTGYKPLSNYQSNRYSEPFDDTDIPF